MGATSRQVPHMKTAQNCPDVTMLNFFGLCLFVVLYFCHSFLFFFLLFVMKHTVILMRVKVLILPHRKMPPIQDGGGDGQLQDEQWGRICLDVETAEEKIPRR